MQTNQPSSLDKYLRPALAGILILAAIWAGLRLLISRPNRPFEVDLGLLLGAAAFCLLLGLSGLTLFLRRAGSRRAGARGLPFALALSYLVPILAFRLPEWALLMRQRPASLGLWRVLGPYGVEAGQSWFFLWQALCLAFYAASWLKISFSSPMDAPGLAIAGRRLTLSLEPIPSEVPDPSAREEHAVRHSDWIVGLLAGLGLWLVTALLFSLQVAPLESLDLSSNPPANAFPLSLMPALLIAAFIISPLAGEWIFRRLLPQRLAAHLPGGSVRWVCAALFALLQSHPLMWLPGFLLGLGLGELVRRTGRLLPAVVAHVLYNVLMFLLNPALIV